MPALSRSRADQLLFELLVPPAQQQQQRDADPYPSGDELERPVGEPELHHLQGADAAHGDHQNADADEDKAVGADDRFN